MYQGGSDDLQGATDDACFASADWGIDFEAEIAVITGDVAIGTSAGAALDSVRLLTLVNDWSLRELIPAELARGFGFLQGKPATTIGPLAVTPDELGAAWQGRPCTPHARLPAQRHRARPCWTPPPACTSTSAS